MHTRQLLRGDARERRGPLPPRGRPHRQLRGLARGVERRRDDPARLVAHQQHARSLGRRGSGPQGRRHPRHLCARGADGRRVVGVQRAEPSRGHPARPRHLLLVRRPVGDARARCASARKLELRGREARLGARTRPRHPDQRSRRHATHVDPRPPRQEHLTTSASSARTRPTSTAPTRRTRSST